MTNRIPHFFFTNNKPTGVNYASSVLSSVVYHDGAEYPYLPGLPFYDGQALDNLPNLGFVGDCTDRFNYVARGHEQKLIDTNERFFTAIDEFNFNVIDLILQWVFELALNLGIGGLIRDVFNWLVGSLGLTTPAPAKLEAQLQDLENHWYNGEFSSTTDPLDLDAISTLAKAKQAQQAMVAEAISAYNEAYRIVTNSGGVYGRRFGDSPVVINDALRIRLTRLRNILFTLTGYADWQPGMMFASGSKLGLNAELINSAATYVARISNLRSIGFRAYTQDVKVYLKNAKELNSKSWATKLVLGLPSLFKSILLVILRFLLPIATVAMVGFLLYSTYAMLDGLSALCSKSQDTLADLKLEQQAAIDSYINGVESMLQEGCCDIKPCDPCPNGTQNCPDIEGSCPDCGSGSGSNTLGVGLQLLLEIDGGSITKYVTVSNVGGDTLDHVPTCGFAPRRNGQYCPPTPSGPSMKPQLNFGELYQKYIDEQGRPFPMDKDWFRGLTTTHPPGVDIPNPRTACNWLDLEMDLGPACNIISPFYNEVKQLISGAFSTGAPTVPTILEAIDTARLSRGLD